MTHDTVQERVQDQGIEHLQFQLEVLSRTEQILTSTLDLEAVLNMVVAEVRDSLNAEFAWVMLQEDDELVWVAAAGTGAKVLLGKRVPLTSGVFGWVVRKGQAALIRDARGDPRFYREVDAWLETTSRSLLAVPLIYRGVPRGVIEVLNKDGGVFDARDLRLMEGIAVPAGIAIENARLFAAVDQALIRREMAEARVRELNRDLEHRAMELAVLNRAGQAIVSTLDLDSVLQLVLKEIQGLVQVEGAAIFLRVPASDAEDDELLLAAVHPQIGAQVGERFPLEDNGVGAVALSEEIMSTDGALASGVRERGVTAFAGVPVRSALTVPLMYQGFVEGIIEVVNKAQGAFDDHDQEILEVVAHSAATAIKNAQLYRHLQTALREEQKARAQLVQAGKLSVVGRMVASVAHELNNPLQTIRNSLFLARDDIPADARGRFFLDIAIDEVYRLSRLVDQLRDVYRPGMADQIQVVKVSEILDQVHILMAPHLEENHVRWDFTPPALPCCVNGLPDQLKQVFLNLSLNACDAMAEGGGALTIAVRLAPEGRQVAIAFRDTGAGIDPRDVPYLFDHFFTTKEAGIGLGLSICYDIVQRHGGRIEVASQLGKGSTFTVWLPLAGNGVPARVI